MGLFEWCNYILFIQSFNCFFIFNQLIALDLWFNPVSVINYIRLDLSKRFPGGSKAV